MSVNIKKADGSLEFVSGLTTNVWCGTTEQYEKDNAAGLIPDGTIVDITDDQTPETLQDEIDGINSSVFKGTHAEFEEFKKTIPENVEKVICHFTDDNEPIADNYDTSLDTTSTNAPQNRVVANAINDLRQIVDFTDRISFRSGFSWNTTYYRKAIYNPTTKMVYIHGRINGSIPANSNVILFDMPKEYMPTSAIWYPVSGDGFYGHGAVSPTNGYVNITINQTINGIEAFEIQYYLDK